MQLHIPDIGEQLRLTEPWTFEVHMEHRNWTLLRHLGVEEVRYWGPTSSPCTLATGTVLTVDRIYIRRGAADFSSVTFRTALPVSGTRKSKGVRFWAKLADVNKIAYEVVP